MSVFRNLDCLSLVVCSNTTEMKLQTVLFLNIFLKIVRFEIGIAAYRRMRLTHGRLRYLLLITSVNKHALSIWPPSITLEMLSSLVRYVALIMFFNLSIFQSQPLCSSYSGLVQYFFAASVTFVVDKTFAILQSNSILDISLLENQPTSIVKKKIIEFNNVSDKWKIQLNIHKKITSNI